MCFVNQLVSQNLVSEEAEKYRYMTISCILTEKMSFLTSGNEKKIEKGEKLMKTLIIRGAEALVLALGEIFAQYVIEVAQKVTRSRKLIQIRVRKLFID